MIGEPCRAQTGSGAWGLTRRPLTLDEALRGCLPDVTTDEEWRALHAASRQVAAERPNAAGAA